MHPEETYARPLSGARVEPFTSTLNVPPPPPSPNDKRVIKTHSFYPRPRVSNMWRITTPGRPVGSCASRLTFLTAIFSALCFAIASAISRKNVTEEVRKQLHPQPCEMHQGVHPVTANYTTDRPLMQARAGVVEYLTTANEDFEAVINNFFDSAPAEAFSSKAIREHYESDENNMHNTTMLVSIVNGNVTFDYKFRSNQHGRANSVHYIVQKIAHEKESRMPNVTFLVMITDGHRPRVATFGSARHWNHWNMLTPVPLGNPRGFMQGWGTPMDGWDKYINLTVMSTANNYPWKSKIEKAMFRGALTMQSYTLGSCNEVNQGVCRRATHWSEVNRGALYSKTKKHPELFDVGFTSRKSKANSPPNAFDGAPPTVEGTQFPDFQKYKYLLNVGNNQGK